MEERSGTHAQRALLALRKRILGGELPGGTRLFEVALAEELGISRTPVRDALSRLAAEALLDRASGGGFVVRSFAVRDVVDTIELRGVLEGTAARLAAERGAPEPLLAEARDILRQIDALFLSQDFDMEGYSRLNSAFHALLARLPQSDVLLREIERITALPFASPSAFLDDSAHMAALTRTLSAAHDQHRALLEAITNREGFRAESIAREHARAARRNVEFLLTHEPAQREGVPGLAILAG
ncbi:GntR family transcriptional regulator [Stagnihabitans tardus]|uniref:GntR family transcriptional regulator n=1 Tax=Stagnihabitans tardus TaxID=2699202 RepID=A0AAE4YCJ5_9RHOB|nr:GntR family transcriptional regulator [Stagnihabitans tardus]NBZ89162.1 GntR family transcriptional regulator [Stagnihabitans tardus]